jgi:hypothetical protein
VILILILFLSPFLATILFISRAVFHLGGASRLPVPVPKQQVGAGNEKIRNFR